MQKKKALLVVAGGRGVPDVLPLLYIQPELVLTITSEEGWETKKVFLDIASTLPSCQVKPPPGVYAYDLDIGMDACRKLCQDYPSTEWDWTFTITSAPKVLAIAAYEVAKEMGVPCWHIDAQRDKVVSLIKKVEVDKKRFFHLSFNDYVKIQGRKCEEKSGPTSDYRQIAQNWSDIAQEIALSKDAYRLTPIFYRHKKSGELDHVVKIPIPLSPDTETSPLLQFLVDQGLLLSSRDGSNEITYYFASKNAAQFLGTGDWLEIYVWSQTNQAKFADDCRWGYNVFKDQVRLELDLAVMYKAQLVIAECKTIEKPFRGQNNYLRDIDAVAELLGRTYVSKVFITNQSGEGQSYEVFKQQAEERNIVIVTGERLHEIGKILEKQAKYPQYPRK